MAVRGFLSGVFWGSVVAALGLGVVSQFVPLPQAPAALPPPQPAVVATPEPVAEPAPAVPPAQTGLRPGQATTPVPEASPARAAAPAVLPRPQAQAAASLALTSPAGVGPAPVLPAATAGFSAPADSAPLSAPAEEPQPPVATATAPQPEPLALAPPALATPAATAPAPTTVAPIDRATAPAASTLPVTPGVDLRPAAADLPPPPPLTAEEQALLLPAPEAAPEAALDSSPPNDKPTILRPVPALGRGAAEVATGRLPRIGDAPQPEPAAPVAEQPALQRFARRFENPGAKPLFALILIDTGSPEIDRASLATLPFPLTFALDPLAPDAASRAALYRAAGQEVIMLATGIPPGATASDLEVTFAAHALALPQSVAVLDLEEAGFQTDRALATEVVPVIKGIGRGLLTWDKGLNAGDQVARRDGLAAAVIYRRLDGENESIPTVKRYLDRAAFKAAQDGRVAVIGTTRDETIAAILEWTVEGRAASLALAPVTAVLTTP